MLIEGMGGEGKTYFEAFLPKAEISPLCFLFSPMLD
jgi:hypothetical protein